MPMEKVEFAFPDPNRDTSDDIKIKDDGTAEIVVEGRRDSLAETPKKVEDDSDDIAIEVVDDTPKQDRGKKPSDRKSVV